MDRNLRFRSGALVMFRIGVLTLILSAAALAQQTVPGTFNTVTPDSGSNAMLPLVSTPTLTLSNGFTPSTVTIPQTVVSEQPETLVSGGMPQSDFIGATTDQSSTTPASAAGDLAPVNPGTVFNFGASGPSLGAIALRFKKEHVQAHRTYTNDDIDKLTSQDTSDGVITATSKGQPITDRNQSGFSPMSGIANMPEATNNPDATQYANGTDQNPADNAAPASQQLPASDTNPK